MLKRLNYTNNFVVRSDKHCTILKLQLGGTLKQTLVNAQHSLRVSCIRNIRKHKDRYVICLHVALAAAFIWTRLLSSVSLFFIPWCTFTSQPAPFFIYPSSSTFPFPLPPFYPASSPPFPSRSFPFLFVLRVLLSVLLIRPDFSPLYTFFNAHFRLYGHFPALLFVSSFASSPSFTFVPFFFLPPLSFLSFPFETNFLILSSYTLYVFSKKKKN